MTSFSRVADDLDGPGAIPPSFADGAHLDRTVRRIAAALLGIMLIVIAVIVFLPGPPDASGQAELQLFLARSHQHGLPRWIDFDLVENLSNVVMFVPIGLLGALALYRRNYLIVLYAGLASGLIELVQLVLLRTGSPRGRTSRRTPSERSWVCCVRCRRCVGAASDGVGTCRVAGRPATHHAARPGPPGGSYMARMITDAGHCGAQRGQERPRTVIIPSFER